MVAYYLVNVLYSVEREANMNINIIYFNCGGRYEVMIDLAVIHTTLAVEK